MELGDLPLPQSSMRMIWANRLMFHGRKPGWPNKAVHGGHKLQGYSTHQYPPKNHGLEMFRTYPPSCPWLAFSKMLNSRRGRVSLPLDTRKPRGRTCWTSAFGGIWRRRSCKCQRKEGGWIAVKPLFSGVTLEFPEVTSKWCRTTT